MFPLRRNRIRKTILKIIVFFTVLFCIQVSINYFWIRFTNLQQISKDISWLNNRIASELKYINGKWDTSIYSADPLTPHPDGTGGFPDPIYIISLDGFVIERNALIHGLLDSGSLQFVTQFDSPHTLSGSTYEQRRVLSKRIIKNNKNAGAVTVSRVIQGSEKISDIDTVLNKNLDEIISKIQFKEHIIDVSLIEIQAIDYNIAFEIIDQYNKVLLSNGRVPTYIDQSYIIEQLNSPKQRIVKDTVTNEEFLIQTKILHNSNNEAIGIIVHGKSLRGLKEILSIYLISTVLTYFIILVPLSVITFYLLRRELKTLLTNNHDTPSLIEFNPQKAKIIIDDDIIHLESDSHQFLLCKILFSNPNKSLSEDLLLNKLGIENWRSLYDAALSINKKTKLRLIIHGKKSYRINPSFINVIK